MMMMKPKESFPRWLATKFIENQFTPDMREIHKYQYYYVFTYGTLQTKGTRAMNRLDEDTTYCGRYRTKKPSYQLYNTTHDFPVAFNLDNYWDPHVPWGFIEGELWMVPSRVIPTLDAIEGNGKMYERDVIQVVGPKDKQVWAFCYLGMPNKRAFAKPQINQRYITSKWIYGQDPKVFNFLNPRERALPPATSPVG